MLSERPPHQCPDCESVTRRQFLKTTAVGIAAGSVVPLAHSPARAADAKAATSETLVAQLYGTLTDEQKAIMAFPFDHPLRLEVNNNWYITEARIATSFRPDQQELIREIFRALHSPEYVDRVMAQVEHDNQSANRRGGFGGCSVAVFGEPGTGKFEFVLAGRHVTRRCDGDSVEGAAFGGPIFYGHAHEGFYEKADHPGNIYWYQALRANELFQALDGKQRAIALKGDPRQEQRTDTVKLRGSTGELEGIPVAELTADQKALVRQVMADVLAPFREADAQECMKLVEQNGFDNLHMAYYKNMDIGDDGVWDVWQVEGPAMVWYFRGSPHVHTWVKIRATA
jgi:hypothetical protein